MDARWTDTFADLATTALAGGSRQMLGTFLAPGSTFSIGALALSFVLFVVAAVPRGRRRPVRLAVLARLVFPRRLLGTASGRTDLAFFILGILFAGLAVGWAVTSAQRVATLASWLVEPLAQPSGWLPLPVWLAAAVATVTLFLAYELAYWVDHWLMHRFAVLWPFHRVHHRAESLSLFTNGRVHPVDTIIFYNIVALFTGIAIALLRLAFGGAVSPFALGGTNLLVMLSAITLTHLQHSHLPLGFGARWSGWLLGPAHHQIHHSVDPAHHNRNLGNSLALFDRVFGTFRQPEERRRGFAFGVDDGEQAPHGWRAGLVQPFVDSARAARQQLPRRGAGRQLPTGAPSAG